MGSRKRLSLDSDITSLNLPSINLQNVSTDGFSALDQSGTEDRYWVQCTLPDNTGASYTEAIVTFSENANNPQGDRVFTALQIIVAP